ncbi:MAG TPA: ABC transporter ATP-binding protein, partial [Pseudobdellovibrionaceae bacterium]|nr:ABC transporter ATP-binding protein [Pseudobdellovibrionaceae bacterium]
TAHSQESVAGIRIVKGFALEETRLRHFNRESRDFEKACNVTAKIDSLFHPVMEFGVTAGTVVFLFAAREDMLSGAASVGTFVAFHRYIMKTVWPMTALGMGLSQLQKGFGAFERIRELFNENPDLDLRGTAPLAHFESLEFRRVGFKYPGTEHWALKNISFRLEKGKSLGISGAVGSGKTTLLALLTRQFDPTEGEIFFNDRPLREYSIRELRETLTLVPQDVFLFSDTVTWNVGFGQGEPFDDASAEEAAKRVDIHDEVTKLPMSYQSMVGEKGVTLSGGQKQRLALARGIVMDSEVLVLDDVLSAVDTKTERRIDEMLRSLREAGRTQILVAHRLSTLMSCDALLVLANGEVECFGAREDVKKRSLFIQSLQEIQGEAK